MDLIKIMKNAYSTIIDAKKEYDRSQYASVGMQILEKNQGLKQKYNLNTRTPFAEVEQDYDRSQNENVEM